MNPTDAVELALLTIAGELTQRAAEREAWEEEKRQRKELQEAFHEVFNLPATKNDSEFAQVWAARMEAVFARLRARGITSLRGHIAANVPGLVIALETLETGMGGVAGGEFASLLQNRLEQLKRFEGPDAKGDETRHAFWYVLRQLRDSVLEGRKPICTAPAVDSSAGTASHPAAKPESSAAAAPNSASVAEPALLPPQPPESITVLPDWPSSNARSRGATAQTVEQGAQQLHANQPSNAATPTQPQLGAKHSDNYRTVDWYGMYFEFTPKQARCVEMLWKAWEERKPPVHQTEIGPALESESDEYRLRDTFRIKKKLHAAWGTMIQRAGKGRFRLVPPANQQ